MYAECTRQSCARQATVLLAFDPRGARAWLRDLVDANPAMGLMLCGDHAETTTVPMSWSLIDERSADLDDQMHEQVDAPPPSFDDIFPPRAAREPDPYGLDPDLDPRQESADDLRDVESGDLEFDRHEVDDDSDDGDERGGDGWRSGDDFGLGPDTHGFESQEAIELLAPELPASGTDGMAIRQPQLPMISTPAREHTDRSTEHRGSPPYGSASGEPTPGRSGDFLFTESAEDRLPHRPETSQAAGSAGTMMGGAAPAAPLFENMAVRTPRLAPPTSPLLSRAFRNSDVD